MEADDGLIAKMERWRREHWTERNRRKHVASEQYHKYERRRRARDVGPDRHQVLFVRHASHQRVSALSHPRTSRDFPWACRSPANLGPSPGISFTRRHGEVD